MAIFLTDPLIDSLKPKPPEEPQQPEQYDFNAPDAAPNAYQPPPPPRPYGQSYDEGFQPPQTYQPPSPQPPQPSLYQQIGNVAGDVYSRFGQAANRGLSAIGQAQIDESQRAQAQGQAVSGIGSAIKEIQQTSRWADPQTYKDWTNTLLKYAAEENVRYLSGKPSEARIADIALLAPPPVVVGNPFVERTTAPANAVFGIPGFIGGAAVGALEMTPLEKNLEDAPLAVKVGVGIMVAGATFAATKNPARSLQQLEGYVGPTIATALARGLPWAAAAGAGTIGTVAPYEAIEAVVGVGSIALAQKAGEIFKELGPAVRFLRSRNPAYRATAEGAAAAEPEYIDLYFDPTDKTYKIVKDFVSKSERSAQLYPGSKSGPIGGGAIRMEAEGGQARIFSDPRDPNIARPRSTLPGIEKYISNSGKDNFAYGELNGQQVWSNGFIAVIGETRPSTIKGANRKAPTDSKALEALINSADRNPSTLVPVAREEVYKSGSGMNPSGIEQDVTYMRNTADQSLMPVDTDYLDYFTKRFGLDLTYQHVGGADSPIVVFMAGQKVGLLMPAKATPIERAPGVERAVVQFDEAGVSDPRGKAPKSYTNPAVREYEAALRQGNAGEAETFAEGERRKKLTAAAQAETGRSATYLGTTGEIRLGQSLEEKRLIEEADRIGSVGTYLKGDDSALERAAAERMSRDSASYTYDAEGKAARASATDAAQTKLIADRAVYEAAIGKPATPTAVPLAGSELEAALQQQRAEMRATEQRIAAENAAAAEAAAAVVPAPPPVAPAPRRGPTPQVPGGGARDMRAAPEVVPAASAPAARPSGAVPPGGGGGTPGDVERDVFVARYSKAVGALPDPSPGYVRFFRGEGNNLTEERLTGDVMQAMTGNRPGAGKFFSKSAESAAGYGDLYYVDIPRKIADQNRTGVTRSNVQLPDEYSGQMKPVLPSSLSPAAPAARPPGAVPPGGGGAVPPAGSGAPPPTPPSPPAPPSGSTTPEPVQRLVDLLVPGEKPGLGILRLYEGAINTQGLAIRRDLNAGNRSLARLKIGRPTAQSRLVQKSPEIEQLFLALHGEGQVPPRLQGVFDTLKGQVDVETAATVGFDPKFMAHPDYFPRGWRTVEVEPANASRAQNMSTGSFGATPGFAKPRVDATFTEILGNTYTRTNGSVYRLEPQSWNPFEQMALRRVAGTEFREQSILIDRLKQSGTALVADGPLPDGYRVPRVGPAFEGKPKIAPGVDGQPASFYGYTDRYAVEDKIANVLENIYGRRVSLGRGPDAILSVLQGGKRAKLMGSLFQQVDFITRTGFASFGGAVDDLISGKPVSAVIKVAKLPIEIGKVIAANLSPSRRDLLRNEILSGNAIFPDRPGVTLKGVSKAGWNQADITMVRRDIKQAFTDSVGDESLTGAAMRNLRRLEAANQRGLFDGVYPQAQTSALKNWILPRLMRQHPNWTDTQIMGQAADEINKAFSTLGDYQTIFKNPYVQHLTHNLIFSTGEPEALIRGAGSMFYGNNKRLWITYYLGGFLFLAATANLIHMASTALMDKMETLPVMRYNPLKIDQNAPFSLKYNTRFLTPDTTIPGEGGVRTVLDLVGQMDTALRLLNPLEFATSRLNVGPRAIQNQISGTDYYGNRIDTVGPKGIVSRAMQFATDLYEPITVNQIRTLAISPKGIRESVGRIGGAVQAAGFNLRAESPAAAVDRGDFESLSGEAQLQGLRRKTWNKVKYLEGEDAPASFYEWYKKESEAQIERFSEYGFNPLQALDLAEKTMQKNDLAKLYRAKHNKEEDEWAILYPKLAYEILLREKDLKFYEKTFSPSQKVKEFVGFAFQTADAEN